MSIVFAAGIALSPLIALQGLTIVDGPRAGAAGLAPEYSDGVCRVSVFGKDGAGEQIRAEFSRRLRDGNLDISLFGPFIRQFRGVDGDANFPVTVVYDTGASVPSRTGGYDVGGFREYAWGGWGPGAASDATDAALRGASTFSVGMNGNSYGPFTWQGTGAVWSALDDCEADNS
jgi:hypothetical protein